MISAAVASRSAARKVEDSLIASAAERHAVVLAAGLVAGAVAAGLIAMLGREGPAWPPRPRRRQYHPSGWSDLGEVDLDTGLPAAAPADQVAGRVASFPDGNNAAGTISDTGVPTGLPFKSSLQREAENREAENREAELDDQPDAGSQADEVRR